MSATNGEKDSLFGQTVLPPELGQILGGLGFLHTLYLGKIQITIIKKFIRPWYGRLLYPYCQALLSHRLLLNKKGGAKKKATLSQKLFYVMATLCDRLLY